MNLKGVTYYGPMPPVPTTRAFDTPLTVIRNCSQGFAMYGFQERAEVYLKYTIRAFSQKNKKCLLLQ